VTATDRDECLADEERRALTVYDALVRPALRAEDDGKYVAIAFERDDFEIDTDDYTAIKRLLARHPGARVWLTRAGRATAYRIARAVPS
jgi:hypothetical protein